MSVPSLLDEPMIRSDAERLEDRMRSDHASVITERAEPDEVGVLEAEERARGYKSGEEVVVEWENVERVDVVIEQGREPDVLRDDLRRRLNDLA